LTKGGLELKPEQAARLEAIILGKNQGNHTTTGRHGRNVKITLEQVIQIKQLFSEDIPVFRIIKETGLSEWIVRGVDSKRYDFILEVNQHGNESR
jgi:hypothetical protein